MTHISSEKMQQSLARGRQLRSRQFRKFAATLLRVVFSRPGEKVRTIFTALPRVGSAG